MLKLNFIVMGSLSEKHWQDACDEYKKRLGADCKVTEWQLKEQKLPRDPGEEQIAAALEKEAEQILSKISPRSYTVALCVEGKSMDSPSLAARLDAVATGGIGEINFIVGSSHGLSEKVKRSANLRLSMSELTFPHQLARVMLYECVYRCVQINRGTKYHK